MSKDNSIYIEHILNSIKLINEYILDHDQDSFLKDTKTQDAVIRQFEIIGEATKQISFEFRNDYPDIPWEDMA